MEWFSELIQKGGPPALSIISLGVPTLVVCTLHAFRPRRWMAWAGGIAVVLIVVTGFVGFVTARGRVTDGMAMLKRDPRNTPADLKAFGEAADAEARVPIEMAGVFASACVLGFLVGELRRRVRQA